MMNKISVVKLFPAWVRNDYAFARVYWLANVNLDVNICLDKLAQYLNPEIRALVLST